MRKKSADSIQAKVRKALREKELGKLHYARADALLKELATEIDCGEEHPLGDSQKFQLEDRGLKDTCFVPAVWRRYELTVKPR